MTLHFSFKNGVHCALNILHDFTHLRLVVNDIFHFLTGSLYLDSGTSRI